MIRDSTNPKSEIPIPKRRSQEVIAVGNYRALATIGVVFIPFHFWEAAANLLTKDIIDPLAKIPEYKAAVVRVTKAEEEELTMPVEPQQRGRY